MYKKILLAYDGSQSGRTALFECSYLASSAEADIHLIAVVQPVPAAVLYEVVISEVPDATDETEHHRKVRKPWHGESERLEHQNLTRCVRDVVLAAHHVGHPHQPVVHHNGEVVGCHAVCPENDGIADDGGVKPDFASHGVVEDDLDRKSTRLNSSHRT